VTDDDRDIGHLAIERAAVRGWPALETEVVDGWQLRASSGGSTRANTVSALDYTGEDLEATVARVEAFYRARSLPPRVNLTPVSKPDGLDSWLGERGWSRHGDHITMAKAVAPRAIPPISTGRLIAADAPDAAWFAVYLEGLSQDRRAVAPALVARVPSPRVFFSLVRDGTTIASGLTVVDGPLASVQCMATLPAARRTGAAALVLDAIERHAAAAGVRRLYLQADAENRAALGLYTSVGFTLVGRYHTRIAPG
jgi:ribosomal protein S18 acetylase RimI-like enzyme